MNIFYSKKFINYGIPLLLAILSMFVGLKLFELQTTLRDKEQIEVLQAIADQQSSNIKQQIDSVLMALEILAQQIKSNPDITEKDFSIVSDKLLNSIELLTNLQLAKNAIVTSIYPLPGNEKAIGHNLLLDEQRREDVLEAIKKRTTIISGPYKTVQGPIAFIARRPIFVNINGSEHFWGFVTAMIHLDRFKNTTGIKQLIDSGFLYQMRSKNNSDTFNFGNEITHEMLSASKTIAISQSSLWEITISKISDERKFFDALAYISLFLICLLVFFVNLKLFKRPINLLEKLDNANEKLAKLEYSDERSNLPNFHYLSDTFNDLNNSSDKEKLACLLLIKIKNFSLIRSILSTKNLSLWYKKISFTLLDITRKKDLVIQFNENTFAIYISDFNNINDVWTFSNMLTNILSKQISVEGATFQQNCSIGICVYGKDGKNIDDLIKRAQIAIDFGEKSNSAVNLFTHNMEAEFSYNAELEADLKIAVNEDEFILHYQPQVNLSTMKIDGFEALVRWQKSKNKLIYPDKFISKVEHMGLIIPIGYSIIKQACQAQSILTNILGSNVRMSINLSAVQFSDPNLFSIIKENILNVGSPPSCYTFEITESLFMNNNELVSDTLNKLDAFGVHIAVDDFGTGYSSFEKLRSLPITELKIDKSFVDNVTFNSIDKGIATTIIKLANELNMRVVAEGIEFDEQHAFMKKYKCDFGQGYFYSRPLDLEGATSLLYEQRKIGGLQKLNTNETECNHV